MDLKIQRPSPTCNQTGSEFKAGDVIFSALVREEGNLVRRDWSHEAWASPPDGTLAWWRSVVPEQIDNGASLAPVDVLLDTLESLTDQPEEASLRYLLALQLLRRKVLRFAESRSEGEGDAGCHTGEVVSLACRRRDCEYQVVAALPEAEEHAVLEDRLASLLWSGGEP